jgi:hypothetical protein
LHYSAKLCQWKNGLRLFHKIKMASRQVLISAANQVTKLNRNY